MYLSRAFGITALVAALASPANAKACKPDVCSLVVQGKDGQSPGQIVQHQKDCSSFLSVTIIPATSTVYEVVSSIIGISSDTVGTLSSTQTDTITVSSTVTDVSIESGATTVDSTDTTTTTTTSTHTSTETFVSSSTWTSSTTTTTSITGTSSATDVLVSIASETDTSTTTATTTHTSTSTSTSYSFQTPAKRSVASEAGSSSAPISALATTISPSHIPDYATSACADSVSLYGSACAAWGIILQTTTLLTPITTVTQTVDVVDTIYVSGHTVVIVDITVTSTATVDSLKMSSMTVTDVSSATETDTLTSSATVTSTSIVPVEVISTKTQVSSTAITHTTTTTTTSTDTTSTTQTISRTVSSVVPWCTDLAVVRAQGCAASEWTLYCNQVVQPLGINRVVFNAPQQSLQECLNICDGNGFCTSGYFNGVTGACVLYLYAGSGYVQLVGTAGAVTAFEFIYGTNQGGYECPAYECPENDQPQCCGGMGCPDYLPPDGV
ncbi:hypothetical protein Sste5346_008756 [Sporothrix stenoceras]|uniref:Apple domain-containing protein n=1 Tax=Sporothrix stenoceras TaxID=5173 RepID=A0ABR3YNF5_9PEZI